MSLTIHIVRGAAKNFGPHDKNLGRAPNIAEIFLNHALYGIFTIILIYLSQSDFMWIIYNCFCTARPP